jgi:hypothetical protein
MYESRLCNEYIKGLDAFIDFLKKDMSDNIKQNLYCPYKYYKSEKKYRTDDILRSDQVRIHKGLSMLE